MTQPEEFAVFIATIGFIAHALYVLRDNVHALIELILAKD